MNEENPPIVNLATYLDSDSDDDILDIGQNVDINETLYGEDFVEFLRRRVSKRIDGEGHLSVNASQLQNGGSGLHSPSGNGCG